MTQRKTTDPMSMTITTPALLFPAISVLFLAYANRFLAIAKRIRELHDRFNKTRNPLTQKQIESLKQRIRLIIIMQLLAVTGIISCVISIGLMFFNLPQAASYAFSLSMLLIVLSLLTSMRELLISTKALNLELEEISEPKDISPLS